MNYKIEHGTIKYCKESNFYRLYLNIETGKIWASVYADPRSYTLHNDENIIFIGSGTGIYSIFGFDSLTKNSILEMVQETILDRKYFTAV